MEYREDFHQTLMDKNRLICYIRSQFKKGLAKIDFRYLGRRLGGLIGGHRGGHLVGHLSGNLRGRLSSTILN